MSDLARELTFLAGLGSWERPDNAKTSIREGLESPDRAVRLTALELAAEEMDPEIAAEAVRLFEADPDPEVRGRAAIVLGPALEEMSQEEGWEGPELGELPLSTDLFHQIEERLEKAYRDTDEPKEVRRRALEAAIRSPRPWQQEAIRSAWASDDPEWRLTAVFCMGLVTGFEDEILEALGSDSPELETEAVRAAGAMGLDKAGNHLVSLAASESTPRDLRLAAIEALGTLSPAIGADVLDTLILSDDKELAEKAQEAFDEMALWSQLEDLEEEIETEDDLS